MRPRTRTTSADPSSDVADARSFQIVLSFRFILTSFVTAIAISLSVGFNAQRHFLAQAQISSNEMPYPVIHRSKFPSTRYISRFPDITFDVESDSILARQEQVRPKNDSEQLHSTSENDFITQPFGQHLLVDVQYVDSDFLDSKQRLASSMIELAKRSKLALLSYHCHHLEPMGVTCVGVMLKSHITFHTWPEEGVITLDLFACGNDSDASLMPAVHDIVELFGVSRLGRTNEPGSYLAILKKRGFRGAVGPRSGALLGSIDDTYILYGASKNTDDVDNSIDPIDHSLCLDNSLCIFAQCKEDSRHCRRADSLNTSAG
jgi:S-adenosylmethionine decarboxylase proenzyme